MPRLSSSCGPKASLVEMTVAGALTQTVNAEGATLALSEEGELCTRGYHITGGYDQEPEATGQAIDVEGRLHTGDLAVPREDGHFHIRGSLKDMIIREGENIYPTEIEGLLFEHPKVADVAVVGLPDLKLGEIVAAWVRPKQTRHFP